MTREVDLTITGGTVVTPSGQRRAGIAIDDGRIVAVAADEHLPPAARDPRRDRPSPAPRPRRLRGAPRLLRAAQRRHRDRDSRRRSTAGRDHLGRARALHADGRPGLRRLRPARRRRLVPRRLRALHRRWSSPTRRSTSSSPTCWRPISRPQEIPEYARDHGVTSYKLYLQSMSPEAEPHWPGRRAGLGHGFDDGTCWLTMEAVADLGAPGRRLHALRELGDRPHLRQAPASRGPHRLGRLVGPLAALPRGDPHPHLRRHGGRARLPDLHPARDHARELSRDPRVARPRCHLPRADGPPLAALRQGRAQRMADQRAAALAREQPQHLAGAARRGDQLVGSRPRRLLAALRLRRAPSTRTSGS